MLANQRFYLEDLVSFAFSKKLKLMDSVQFDYTRYCPVPDSPSTPNSTVHGNEIVFLVIFAFVIGAVC
jgi:hypothetical protein